MSVTLDFIRKILFNQKGGVNSKRRGQIFILDVFVNCKDLTPIPDPEFNESPKGREIEISAKEQFPIPIRVKDDSGSVVDTYRIVRTKSNKFMLQK